MPISAEQWRVVVGSNNVRRPRQIGPKCFLNLNQPPMCKRYTESKALSAVGYPSQESVTCIINFALFSSLILWIVINNQYEALSSDLPTLDYSLGKFVNERYNTT